MLVRQRQAGDELIQLGAGVDIPVLGHAGKVCQALHARAKDMVAERNRNAGTPRAQFGCWEVAPIGCEISPLRGSESLIVELTLTPRPQPAFLPVGNGIDNLSPPCTIFSYR